MVVIVKISIIRSSNLEEVELGRSEEAPQEMTAKPAGRALKVWKTDEARCFLWITSTTLHTRVILCQITGDCLIDDSLPNVRTINASQKVIISR